jgi:hypothetical protein
VGADNGAGPEAFNLDALERDSKDRFPFQAGGQTFHLANPDDLDWHVEAELDKGDLATLFRNLLGDEFEAFDKIPMPAWKLEALLRASAEFYGISLPESRASSVSSAAKATPSRPTSVTTTVSGSQTSRPDG